MFTWWFLFRWKSFLTGITCCQGLFLFTWAVDSRTSKAVNHPEGAWSRTVIGRFRVFFLLGSALGNKVQQRNRTRSYTRRIDHQQRLARRHVRVPGSARRFRAVVAAALLPVCGGGRTRRHRPGPPWAHLQPGNFINADDVTPSNFYQQI